MCISAAILKDMTSRANNTPTKHIKAIPARRVASTFKSIGDTMTITRFNRILWAAVGSYIFIRLYMMVNDLLLTYGG